MSRNPFKAQIEQQHSPGNVINLEQHDEGAPQESQEKPEAQPPGKDTPEQAEPSGSTTATATGEDEDRPNTSDVQDIFDGAQHGGGGNGLGPFEAYVEAVSTSSSKPGAKKEWKRWDLEYSANQRLGKASTFSQTIGDQVAQLHEGDRIRITIEPGKRGDLIKVVELLQEEEVAK